MIVSTFETRFCASPCPTFRARARHACLNFYEPEMPVRAATSGADIIDGSRRCCRSCAGSRRRHPQSMSTQAVRLPIPPTTVVAIPIRGPNNGRSPVLIVARGDRRRATATVSPPYAGRTRASTGIANLPSIATARTSSAHVGRLPPASTCPPRLQQVLDHVVVAEIHRVEQVGIFAELLRSQKR